MLFGKGEPPTNTSDAALLSKERWVRRWKGTHIFIAPSTSFTPLARDQPGASCVVRSLHTVETGAWPNEPRRTVRRSRFRSSLSPKVSHCSSRGLHERTTSNNPATDLAFLVVAASELQAFHAIEMDPSTNEPHEHFGDVLCVSGRRFTISAAHVAAQGPPTCDSRKALPVSLRPLVAFYS